MKPIKSCSEIGNDMIDAAEEKRAQKHMNGMFWAGYIAAPLLLVYVIPVVKQLLLRNGSVEFLFAMGKDPILRNCYLAADAIVSICWALILIGTILALLKYTKEDQVRVSRVLMIEALVILIFEYLIHLLPTYGYIFIYIPANMTLSIIAAVSYIVVWGYTKRTQSKTRKRDQDTTLV